MSDYNLFAGVNSDYEFPPEVRAALLESLNIRNVGAPMTTNQRNALNTAELDPGYYIFNTQTQTFQIWRADFEEWHDGLDAPGTQKWWPGSIIPSGWKKQDGASLPRAKYFALYGAIGVTHGGSDTPTHFRLPNTGGRMPIDANDTYSLGLKAGSATVQLTEAHMPSHQHGGSALAVYLEHQHSGTTAPAGNHSHNYWWITTGEINATGGGPAANAVYRASRSSTGTDVQGNHTHDFATSVVGQTHSHFVETDFRGGNVAHDNMPPYFAGHFIIKY